MDNNFNQNQQPNNMYAQQFGNQQPKKPSNINLMELLALIFAGVGMLLVFIGTIFTCTCSAKASMKNANFTLSPVFMVTIFGILFAIAAIVCAIISMKDKKDIKSASKLAIISFVVGVFAIIYGLIPTVTVCGYNCSLNNNKDVALEDALDKLGDLDYSDFSDMFN